MVCSPGWEKMVFQSFGWMVAGVARELLPWTVSVAGESLVEPVAEPGDVGTKAWDGEGLLPCEVLVYRHSESKTPEAKHERPESGESAWEYTQSVRHSWSLAAAASPRPCSSYRMSPTLLLWQHGPESKNSTLLLTGELLFLRQTVSDGHVSGGDSKPRSKWVSSWAQPPIAETVKMLRQTPWPSNASEHLESADNP